MKIKNRNFHKKRYLEKKMIMFLFPHDKGTKDYIGFCWINGINQNPINDMALYRANQNYEKNKPAKYDKQGYPITQLDRYGAITKLLP